MNSSENPKVATTTTTVRDDEAIFHEATHFLVACSLWFQAHPHRNYHFQEVSVQVYNWLCDTNLAARSNAHITTGEVQLVIRRPLAAEIGDGFGSVRDSLRAIPLPPQPSSVETQDDDAAGQWLYDTFRPGNTNRGVVGKDW